MERKKSSANIIIFDGKCGFCNRTTLFLAKKDINNVLVFMSNISKEGEELLKKNNIDFYAEDSILLLKDGIYYKKSKAFFHILREIPHYKFLSNIVKLIPHTISDSIYDIISRNRMKIVKNSQCPIPDENIRKKFIL